MVTFHGENRHPRGPSLTSAYRAGRIDFDIVMAQAGRTTVQLLVFQPGTSTAERVKVGIYSWIVTRKLFVLIGLFAGIFAPQPFRAGGLWWMVGFGVAVAAAAALLSWHLARPTLAAAHGIRVGVRAGKNGAEYSGEQFALLEEYANRLAALDAADLDPVEHEAQWTRIYNDLSAINNQARSNS